MYEGAATSEPLVSLGQRVTYWGVFPALVTLGVVTNGLSIVVLRRPPLRSLQVNSVYGCVVWWGPGVLMAAFNLSLVVAVLQGRVRYRPSTEFRKEGRQGVLVGPWEQNLVITMIAMATSYLVLTLPLTIFLTYYADSASDQCSKSEPHDILRLVASSLVQLQHVIHPVFLVCINPAFKRELRNTLHFVGGGVVSEDPSVTMESNTNTLI